MPTPSANSLKVILPFAIGGGLMLGIGLSFHRQAPSEIAPPPMRVPTVPTGTAAIVTRAPLPIASNRGVSPVKNLPQLVAISMAKSVDAPVTVMPQGDAVEIRAAVPIAPIPVLATTDNVPRAVVFSPLPEPEYRPFKDRLTDYFRAVPPKAEGIPLIYQAVLVGDTEWLQQLLREGHLPDEATDAGDTALCAAVWFGNEECVRSLLLFGANANLAGREKQPPLALASLRRSTEILKALLVSGAEPNGRFECPLPKSLLETVTVSDLKSALRTDRGVTPLIACTARGDVEGVLTLMAHGAKASVPTTKDYRYPINFACTQKYLFLSRILLGRSPDSEPDLLVTVDLSQQRAWITRNGKVVDSTTISTGREGYGTPMGRYLVTDKHREWVSTLYKVAMPWFMRLDCSAIGLHSGYVTGRPASHGCIRLPPDKARSFFNVVSVGDEVQIVR